MERLETLELEADIRARWREAAERSEPSFPLTQACDRWVALGERLNARAANVRIEIGAPRERGVPDDIASALNHNAPQAILRDLHRPIHDFMLTELDRTDVGWDRGARSVMHGIRAQIREKLAVPIRALLDNQKTIREDLGELAHLKSLPWEQAPKLSTDAPTTTSAIPEEVPSIRDEIKKEKGLL